MFGLWAGSKAIWRNLPVKLYQILYAGIFGLTVTLPNPALAEFTLGGYINGEIDRDNYSEIFDETIIRANLAGGYDDGNVRFGVGVDWDSNEDSELDSERLYFFAGFGGFTLTYGEIWGSGAIAGEEYWNRDDATSRSDETVRLDFQSSNFVDIGSEIAAKAFGFALSVSHDLDAPDDPNEFGAAFRYGNTFAIAAYEADVQDLAFIFGQHHGPLTYHLAVLRDLDNDDPADSQFGGSVFYDVNQNWTLGANLMLDGDGDYYSSGLSALYQTSSGVNVLLELMDENNGNSEGTSIEFGFFIPIGSSQPAIRERMGSREYHRAYGF